MPVGRIRNLIRVWQDRYEELGAQSHIKYVFIFENKGEAVGVTLHHPHGQIYAFPYIPPKVEKELKASEKYFDQHGKCLFCATLEEEYKDGRRIVFEGGTVCCVYSLLCPLSIRSLSGTQNAPGFYG